MLYSVKRSAIGFCVSNKPTEPPTLPSPHRGGFENQINFLFFIKKNDTE